ncbi:MAG: TetR/AcrR family transcriptional regulator [Armatimonadetes bacterium]|jgi:AcrR family transcriptional regulator|nr:TetR/AcrR family transcriptional regulator [Armatimonadota bacterium]
MCSELGNQKSRDSTREHLLAAGLGLLAEKGYQGSTAREIARVAGVTEVTLYRHFRSKDELFSAAIAEEAARVTELIPELSGNIEEDLCSLARYMNEQLSAERDRLIRVLPELGRHPEMLGQNVAEAIQQFLDRLSSFFRYYQQSGDLTSDVGDEVTAVFLGPMYANVLMGDVAGIFAEFDYEQYVRHFLDGYRKPKQTD